MKERRGEWRGLGYCGDQDAARGVLGWLSKKSAQFEIGSRLDRSRGGAESRECGDEDDSRGAGAALVRGGVMVCRCKRGECVRGRISSSRCMINSFPAVVVCTRPGVVPRVAGRPDAPVSRRLLCLPTAPVTPTHRSKAPGGQDWVRVSPRDPKASLGLVSTIRPQLCRNVTWL